MDTIRPLYPSSLDDPVPPPDPFVDHRMTFVEAVKCPCWKCQKRLVCSSDCERFKRYVSYGSKKAPHARKGG